MRSRALIGMPLGGDSNPCTVAVTIRRSGMRLVGIGVDRDWDDGVAFSSVRVNGVEQMASTDPVNTVSGGPYTSRRLALLDTCELPVGAYVELVVGPADPQGLWVAGFSSWLICEVETDEAGRLV